VRLLPLELEDRALDLLRELVGEPVRSACAIHERLVTDVLVAVPDLVAGFSGDPVLFAPMRHLLAV
jgi:hypothetical protein